MVILKSTAVLALLPVCCLALFGSDLSGPYCAARPRGCCASRQDECSAPILGTLCYCDDFCNRTYSDDCCPDYLSVCKGIQPPPQEIRQCYFNGRYYKDGESLKINCNKCKCQEMSGHMELLCERFKCLVEPSLVTAINKDRRRLGWRAANYSLFWGRRLEEGLTLRLGTLHSRKRVTLMTPIKKVIDPSRIPRTFDARLQWRGLISPPRDQGWCGASWVISTVQVASDRWVVMTGGKMRSPLSPQHLLSCNSRNQRGCQGGHLSRAWNFIKRFGLVSEKCYPWVRESVDTGIGECKLPKNRNKKARCLVQSGTGVRHLTPLYRVSPAYRVATEEHIKHEIMENGPVQATMKVYHDFFVYSGGVYRCSEIASGSRTGFHSVRIVGWGEEQHDGQIVMFWIVANSWGESWGENGFFRIRRGMNECLIEDFVIAAWINNVDMEYNTLDASVNTTNYNNALSNVI